MLQINTHEAKTRLSEIIKYVEESNELVQICRHGKPVVELKKISKYKDPFKRHPELEGTILEDPTLPLDESDWMMNEDTNDL